MVVALGELDLELDAGEERRRRVEHELVAAGLEVARRARRRGRRRRSPRGEHLSLRGSSTRTPAAGRPAAGVEHVCGDGDAHAANLRACARWSRAISASSARTSAPPRTTSSPLDDEPVDAMRRREDEPGDGILGAAELEAVRAPDREVGALARLERADVVAAEHGRAAACPEAKRLARGHRPRPAAPARDEQRLLHLAEQVAPLVRRRAVDAEARRGRRRRGARARARRPLPDGGSTSGSGRRPSSRPRSRRRRRRRDGRSGRTTRPGRASRGRSGTRRACSRRAPCSTPPPPWSRPGGCEAGGRAAGRASPTPSSAAS